MPTVIGWSFRRWLPNLSGASVATRLGSTAGAPESFAEAAALARSLIDAHPARLVVETYARERAPCDRCTPDLRFPLAAEDRVFAAIGHV